MGSLEELFEVKGDGRGVVVSCNFRKFQSVGPFVVVVLGVLGRKEEFHWTSKITPCFPALSLLSSKGILVILTFPL